MVGWGSTQGAICGAVNQVRRDSKKVARLHLRHLNPLPHSLADTFARFKKVLVPEMNTGQLVRILTAAIPEADYVSLHKVTGRPFSNTEIADRIRDLLT